MRIAMIGTGYVGLVSGACIADFGHQVTCVDKDSTKISALNSGDIPIYEPGLKDIVQSNVHQGRLQFTTALGDALDGADAVFIAVGTPSRRGDGHADLSYVYQAAREIALALTDFTVVITKSTVPVGTGDEVERIIRELRPDVEVAVVSNPEFLREGAAIHDFKHPDRIVIGTDDERAKKILSEIYRPLYLNQAPILCTGRRTAELIKYAANAFLATKITFINEIADLCEKLGADVQEVAQGIGLDKRIGSKFLHAGPGFGGSCFPKDVRALVKTAQDHDVPMRILEAIETVNDTRKRAMARKVSAAFAGVLRGKTVAVLGLTFKPNTDDMREAPSIPLITALQDMGAKVRVYDPVGMEQAKQVLTDVTYCEGPYDCVEETDAAVIVTEWEQFRALELERLRDLMACPVIVDLRNIYSPEDMKKQGFAYTSVGRAPTFQPVSVFVPSSTPPLSRVDAVFARDDAQRELMTGLEPPPEEQRREFHKMGQSVYEIIEGTNNEAQAKLRETALQPQTGVDTSSLGQLRDAIKSDSLRRWTAGIDVDGIDDLILYASQRKPLCSPLQSPFAPLTTASPSMAPGIGGFNIDAPKPEGKAFKGHITVADTPASSMQNLVSQAPLQAQQMAAIVESGETSLVPRLFAVIAIAGLLLLGFRDEIRNHLSYSLQTITPLCNVSNAETSVR